MTIEPLGDAAYLLRELSEPAYALASALNRCGLPGLVEAVASYDTVGIYVDPAVFKTESIAVLPFQSSMAGAARQHTIPVCYEYGADLAEAAEHLGMAPESLIEIHSSRTYRCYAIGFCPGFPYLGYLDDRIARLPRRSSPRIRVEPGSVAITGRQTGIYPLERPGGWWLIGQTPLTLVDEESGYFPIESGDEVRFSAIGVDEFARLRGARL